MDRADAERILGLRGSWGGAELKKAYRTSALQNHTDVGGDDEAMKRVNLAYELLSKYKSPASHAADRETRKQDEGRFDAVAAACAENILSQVDKEAFASYAASIFGGEFKCTTDFSRSSGYLSMGIRVANDTSSTVLEVSMWLDINQLLYGTPVLSFDSLDATVGFTTSILHDKRKVKIGSKNYDWKSSKTILHDPRNLFPEAKLRRGMSVSKARKFRRSDAELAMREELNASSDTNYTRIPMGNDLRVTMYRMTFGGQAAWGFNGLYRKYGRIAMLPTIFLPEDEPTIRKLISTLKSAYGKTEQEIINAVKTLKP
jgi:hypothetical protein